MKLHLARLLAAGLMVIGFVLASTASDASDNGASPTSTTITTLTPLATPDQASTFSTVASSALTLTQPVNLPRDECHVAANLLCHPQNQKIEPIGDPWVEKLPLKRQRFISTCFNCDAIEKVIDKSPYPIAGSRGNFQCWCSNDLMQIQRYFDINYDPSPAGVYYLACAMSRALGQSKQWCGLGQCCTFVPSKIRDDTSTNNLIDAPLPKRDTAALPPSCFSIPAQHKIEPVGDGWMEYSLYRHRFIATCFTCDEIKKIIKKQPAFIGSKRGNFQCWSSPDLPENQLYMDVSCHNSADGLLYLACAMSRLIDRDDTWCGLGHCCHFVLGDSQGAKLVASDGAETNNVLITPLEKLARDAADTTDISTLGVDKRSDMTSIEYVEPWLEYGYLRLRFRSKGHTCPFIGGGLAQYNPPKMPSQDYKNVQCWGKDENNPTFDVSTYKTDDGIHYVACAISYIIDASKEYCLEKYCCTYNREEGLGHRMAERKAEIDAPGEAEFAAVNV